MSITFNNTYLGGITSQSAAFQTTFTTLVNAVEAFFNQQFSDTVTLNVSFDWQALNPGYVDVYSTALGQVTLSLIAICWGMALWWLARMSQFQSPERFLLTVVDNGPVSA